MEMLIAKHSYTSAFRSIEENAACWVNGKYTRVWFNKDGSTVVRQNTVGTKTKLLTGKAAAAVAAFVKTNLDAAK